MTSEQDVGGTNFFGWLAGRVPAIAESLAALSGATAGANADTTSVTTRINEAWVVPMEELTCEQVRLLLSQKMGLKWLAEPVVAFVEEHPKANVTFFEGAMSVAALRAMPELMQIVPNAARKLADIDLFWMTRHWAEIDPAFAREIDDLLSRARILARGHP